MYTPNNASFSRSCTILLTANDAFAELHAVLGQSAGFVAENVVDLSGDTDVSIVQLEPQLKYLGELFVQVGRLSAAVRPFTVDEIRH